MVLNAIYSTFQGEVNPYGMGAPVIFIRLGGCHLRCYNSTLGILCDTPEALSRVDSPQVTPDEIYNQAVSISNQTGIKLVTLTGGDPLWNDEKEVKKLLTLLTDFGFSVCVETSGTISWLPYTGIDEKIYWILDYKLASTGVKNAGKLFEDAAHLNSLSHLDYIKFVVHGKEDFNQLVPIVKYLYSNTQAVIALGCFWGAEFNIFQLFELCKGAKILEFITLNMQTHKLAISANYGIKIPEKI